MEAIAKKVFYAILPERCVYDRAHVVGQKIAYRAGQKGFTPIYTEYGRTDVTRQGCAKAFMEVSENPLDTLVMLDIDHDHPATIVEMLAQFDDYPVIVPLMFRRSEPYQACAFRRDQFGDLHHLASFPPGIFAMQAVGAGAIAIQRRVFTQLQRDGHEWFWKYEYHPGLETPSEDLYFSSICEQSGIKMFVDTQIETPHMTLGFIDRSTHEQYMVDNPDCLGGTRSLKNA